MKTKQRKDPALRFLRHGVIAVGLLAPTLFLVPLGSLWLWQKGYLLYWAIAACLTTLAAYLVQRRLLPADIDIDEGADPAPYGDTPLEARAWDEVRAYARSLAPDAIQSRQGAFDVATTVVERVARTMRPNIEQPLLHFTTPEALAVIEQVSNRVRTFIEQSVPLGDRLTVAQLRRLYEWRGTIDVAQSLYDIWRLLRFANPLTALTHEMREQMSKKLYAWSKDHVAKRLTEVFVEEVGRAAIDLYSGRLKTRATDGLTDASLADAQDIQARAIEPLRLFVAGQSGSGKSSLVNALATEADAAVDLIPTTRVFSAYELKRDGLPAALIIDSPGLGHAPEQRGKAIEEAAQSDLILWVAAAHRADREIDREALLGLRAYFSARPDRRAPPILLVLTGIDQLRPWGEWAPPYSLEDANTVKAQSIKAAVLAAGRDLGFSASDIVPVCLSEGVGLYNIDAVWGKIIEALPDSRRAQLVRVLRSAEGKRDWMRIWSQAASGSRVLARQILGQKN